EIGALARTIAHLQDTLRKNQELNRSIAEQRESRARRRAARSVELDRFVAEIESTLAELGRISDAMTVAATSPPAPAAPPTPRTAARSAASSDASANVRDIASAADELAASVSEIDRQVAQSNAIATKAVTEAEWTSATVKELNEAAGRIGDVVKLITDIAEQ